MTPLLRLVSWRHLWRRPSRALLTTLGLALGVTAVVAIHLANQSVTQGLRRVTEQVAGRAELVISGDRTGISESLLSRVRATPGIRHAAPLVKQVAALREVNGRPATGMIQIYAVDALDDRSVPDATFRKEDLELDDPILFLNQPRSLIVTRTSAERHGILGQADRARVALTTSQGVLEFTVRGFLRSDGPQRIFGGDFALMDVFSAQKVFGKEHKLDEIRVLLREGVHDAEREEVRRRLIAALATGSTWNVLRTAGARPSAWSPPGRPGCRSSRFSPSSWGCSSSTTP
jgi:putative ABC transport system permease protein